MWTFERSSDAEGLRLIQAFFQITDPDIRAALIDAAERAAAQSRPAVLSPLQLPQDNEPDAARSGER